jgi:hypothetical protein
MELNASAELISTEKQLGLNLLAGCQIPLADLPAGRFEEAVAKLAAATSGCAPPAVPSSGSGSGRVAATAAFVLPPPPLSFCLVPRSLGAGAEPQLPMRYGQQPGQWPASWEGLL